MGRGDLKSLSTRHLHIDLSLTTALVIIVIILPLNATIHGSTNRVGIGGNKNVKPYEVLVGCL